MRPSTSARSASFDSGFGRAPSAPTARARAPAGRTTARGRARRWDYVARFTNYSAIYGSIGGVILLMLWLYLTSYVLLVGAEVGAEIEAAAQRERPAREVRRAA